MIVALAAQLAPLAAPGAALADPPVVTPATGTTGWAVLAGPSSTMVPRDGTGGVAEFTYNYLSPGYIPGSNNGQGNGSGVPTQTWRFSSTATVGATITMPWRLHGLHAWAGVTVDLRAYIKRGGIDVQNTDLLNPVQEGPVSCCTTPSNGFDYSGATSLTLLAGDEFGFIVSGGNGDSNSFLQGDLQVGLEGVLNGSFENPVISSGSAFQIPSDASLADWALDSGDLDLIKDDYWQAADGHQSLDLDGTTPGQISQVIPTVPGQQYAVYFQYSANPDDPTPPATDPQMDVRVDGDTVGSFTHTRPPHDVPSYPYGASDMQYAAGQATFTATGSTTTLAFASTDPVNYPYGVVIDAVSVLPVFGNAVAATDFTFGTPSPSAVNLQPGNQANPIIPLNASGTPATVSLTASVTPAGQGVSVSLTSASVLTGSADGLNVVATANAVPGTYTATVTGHLGANTHSVSVPVTVTQSAGIPGLVQAVPALVSTHAFADTGADADGLFLTGMVNGPSGAHYDLTLLTAATCPDGVLGGGSNTQVATFDPTNGANPLSLTADVGSAGTAYFGGPMRVTQGSLSNFVAAQIGSGPVGPCIVVSPPNDQWPYATDITAKTGGGSPTTGFVDTAGRARWYKFTVQPGASVHVSLTNLHSDDDVFLFTDIGSAYAALAGGPPPDLTRLSAEFASADVANAFTSNAFTSNAFTSNAFTSNAFTSNAFTSNAFTSNAFTSNAFTSNAFTSNAFTSNAFTSNAFTSNAFTSNAFTSNAFTSNAFTSNAFTSNAFTSNAFTSSGDFNPFGVNPDAYSSAQLRSVIAGSANVGTASESFDANTWTNTGTFYVRVNGKGDASSDLPFTLSVQLSGNTCVGVSPVAGTFTAPASDAKTLILWDSSRMQSAQAGDISTLRTTLGGQATAGSFAGKGEIAGAVVDLGDTGFAGHARIAALNQQADAHPACVYAKNLVASAIRDIVTAYRAANPHLADVVLVGDDGVIPFFRYPDQNSLGPESNYVPPVDPASASEASLRSDYILGQDEYGSKTSLSLGTYAFPIPDLPVGRLVETPGEATGILRAYLDHTTNGLVAPTGAGGKYSSLVTGYDFLADAATTVSDTLATGTAATPQQLINNSWTGPQLKSALTDSRHDLIFLAGHFSSSLALAADYTPFVQTTDLASSSVDLTNSIVFSAGCHSGYNLVDSDKLANVSQPLDWAQAFAQKGATLIAGTGYQYGDSDFELWSERIYAEFAHQLQSGSGAIDVGGALVRSKQRYLETSPSIQPMDAKALLQATIYGLPMLSVNLPTRDTSGGGGGSIVTGTTHPVLAGTPGSGLGLETSDQLIPTAPASHTQQLDTTDASGHVNGHIDTTYLTGPDGLTADAGLPVLPLQAEDVTAAGQVLRGVGFLGGSFTDQSGVIPLTGAPGTELSTARQGFSSSSFWPSQPWRVNYFDALSGGGTTQLLLTPAQYRTEGNGPEATLRTYSSLNLRLFYSSETGYAALASAPALGNVTATYDGTNVTFQTVITENPAGVQDAWITYTGTAAHANDWTSIPLVQDPQTPGVWRATLPLSAGDVPDLRFMAQAVNGVGLVGRADNLGAFFGISDASSSQTAASATTLSLDGSDPSSAAFGSSVGISATLTAGATPLSGKAITLTLGSASKVATTNASGVATATFTVLDTPGSTTLRARFDGDPGNLPSGDSDAFTIAKGDTSLTLNGPAGAVPNGADSGVTATLLDHDGAPVPFKTIFFVLSGAASRTSSAITGIDGTAALGLLPPNGGAYTITACFDKPGGPAFGACPTPSSPDADYSASGDTGSVQQLTRSQTITFPAILGQTLGTADFPANATASSGLPVTLTPTGNCTIVGGLIHLTGAGPCTITASQPGNTDYSAATPVAHAFSIVNPVPTVTSVVPPSIGRGAIAFPVTVVGTGFVPGATVTISGTGVTVGTTTVVDPSHITVLISVSTSASLTNRNVSVANLGTSSGTCTACLNVNQGPYGIAPIPFSLGRGALNETVNVVGFNFTSGTWTSSSVQFSNAGITVNSVTRVSSVQLAVNLSITSTAATGAGSVTVVNPDGGRSTAIAAFTVNAAPVVTSLSPASRGQGATNETVVITGSNFGSGTWATSSVSFSGTGITVNSVTRTDASHLTVNLSVAATATLGARDVTVRNTDFGRATRVAGFTVTAGPGITSLSPGSRGQGATNQVITLTGSNFVAGSWPTSAVAFSGSGITVNSVTRTDASHLSVNVSVSTTAATGARTVTVHNLDGGIASLANAFTVNARPTITSLSPNSRARGQANQTIVVTGTGFVNGAIVSFSGSGITVVSVTWTDASHLSVKVSVASGAATGNRNVTVTNPDQGSFTLSNGFKVT